MTIQRKHQHIICSILRPKWRIFCKIELFDILHLSSSERQGSEKLPRVRFHIMQMAPFISYHRSIMIHGSCFPVLIFSLCLWFHPLQSKLRVTSGSTLKPGQHNDHLTYISIIIKIILTANIKPADC